MRGVFYKALIITFLASGCASLQPGLGFDEVANNAQERIQKEVRWNHGTSEDQAVERRIADLFSQPLTPDTAVQIALLNNRRIQGMYQELSIAQADLVQAGLLDNPVLSSEIRFPPDGVNLELSLVQNFLNALQIPLRKKIAAAQFEETKARVVGEILTLAAQTRLAFFEYQAVDQRIEVVKTALDSLEASALLAQRLHNAGNLNRLDWGQQQAIYQRFKLDVALREQELIEKREALNALLGVWREPHEWRIEQRLPEPLEHAMDTTAVEEQVIARSIDLEAARREIQALAHSAGLASQFALLNSGDLELGGSASKEGEGDWGFGPALTIPLPLFNQGQPQRFRAQAELRKKVEFYADQATALRATARSLTRRLLIARDRTVYFKRTLLPLQAEVVSEFQKQYNGMLIGVFQLLDAKRQQIELAEEYVESLRDYWLIQTRLQALQSGKNLESLSFGL